MGVVLSGSWRVNQLPINADNLHELSVRRIVQMVIHILQSKMIARVFQVNHTS
jgi:hypothetical protein